MGRYSAEQLQAHVDAKTGGDPKQIAETGIELIDAALHGGKLNPGQFPPLFRVIHGEKLKAPKIANCPNCANRESNKLRNVRALHEKTLQNLAAQAPLQPPQQEMEQSELSSQQGQAAQTSQVEQRTQQTPTVQDAGLIPKVGKFEQGMRFASNGAQPCTIVGFSTNKRKVVLLKADGNTIEISLEEFKENYKAA